MMMMMMMMNYTSNRFVGNNEVFRLLLMFVYCKRVSHLKILQIALEVLVSSSRCTSSLRWPDGCGRPVNLSCWLQAKHTLNHVKCRSDEMCASTYAFKHGQIL